MSVNFYVAVENYTGAFLGLFDNREEAEEAANEVGGFVEVYSISDNGKVELKED